MGWLAFAAALLLLLVIVLLSDIHAHVIAKRKGSNDQFEIRVTALYGLIQRTFNIPIVKLDWKEGGLKFRFEQSTASKSKTNKHTENYTPHRVKEMLSEVDVLLKHTAEFKQWLKKTLPLLRCTRFAWVTAIGVGEAPETAMATGVLWAIKSTAIAFLFRRIQLKTKPEIEVIPCYNTFWFTAHIEMVVHMRFFHLLWAMLQLLKRIVSIPGGWRVWRKHLKSRKPNANAV